MARTRYPLEQVLQVKRKREDDAAKVVKEKKQALEKEEEKLMKLVAKRDEVKNHYDDKLKQLRQTLDEGTTSDKIQQAKSYLKIVQGNLEKEEKKVKEQKDQVAIAQKNYEAALADLKARRQEVEKIRIHKEEWEKEESKRIELKEENEQDEIGSTMYLNKQRKDKQ